MEKKVCFTRLQVLEHFLIEIRQTRNYTNFGIIAAKLCSLEKRIGGKIVDNRHSTVS